MNTKGKKDKNTLITKRRRKKMIKRCMILIILLTATLVILCLKLPIFNVTNIYVQNNKLVPSDKIIKLSNIQKGSNIFYINLYRSKNSILNNPYIKTVNISRKLPNEFVIFIQERAAKYYNVNGNDFYVVDTDGVVLEKRDNIKNMKLTQLSGFDYSRAVVGHELPCDNSKKFELVSTISNLMGMVDINMTSMDVTSINDIKINFENMTIKLGNKENLEKKLNEAINIFKSNKDYKTSKGYIDVSYNGSPVISIEK